VPYRWGYPFDDGLEDFVYPHTLLFKLRVAFPPQNASTDSLRRYLDHVLWIQPKRSMHLVCHQLRLCRRHINLGESHTVK
jgi:hypothetical protein